MASIDKASGMRPLNKTYSLQQNSRQQDLEQKLRQVGDMYEEHFINHMVKQMRGSISHSELTKPTMSESIYRSKLDDEYVKAWVGKGGLGLSDIIFEQLMEKFSPKINSFGKPKGPIPLNQQKMFKLEKLQESDSGQSYKIELNEKSPVALTSPWKANLIEAKALNHGMNSLLLDHGNGVQSSYIFQGQALGLVNDQGINPGQPIANLAPGSNLFFGIRTT